MLKYENRSCWRLIDGRQILIRYLEKSGKSPPATRRLFGRAVPGSYHRASPARPARPNPCPLTESLPVIGRLSGLLAEKNPPQILIDCQGVGYEVWVPMSTFYNLPALGERTTLLTHFVVREDAQLLYGFGSDTERAAFRELIKIGGIGPRMALAVLSGMSVADLAQAVSAQDGARLTKVPGIGKKTAERLLLELKGKLGADLGAPQAPASDAQSDIQQALLALGYSDKEATAAVKTLPADVGVSEGIKLALRALAK